MKVVIEIEGREARQVTREVIIEVPDGTTKDDINEMNPNVICDQLDDYKWDVVDTDGVDPDELKYVGEADDRDHVDCTLVRTGDGELVPQSNGGKPVKCLCDCKEGLRMWSCNKCGQRLLICDDCRKTTALYCAEC